MIQLLYLLGALLLGNDPEAARFSVQWNPAQGRVEVSGLPPATLESLSEMPSAELLELLKLQVESSDIREVLKQLPMAGRHLVEDDRFCFKPMFPLEPGLVYTAEFNPGKRFRRVKAGASAPGSNCRRRRRPPQPA